MTDVTATNTEQTGAYEVVQREAHGGVMTLRVHAMQPDRAEAIATHLVQQVLTYSPAGVVVEVAPHPSLNSRDQPRRITWERPPDVRAADVVAPQEGTAPGDRTGQPGQH